LIVAKRKASPASGGRKSTVAAMKQDATPSAAETAVQQPIDTANYMTGNLDIHCVESTYREFRGFLASGLPVVIDVSRLDAIDTAGVQLLLAFTLEADRRSVPFNLRGDSPAFSSALDRLGLAGAFATVRRHG